MPHEQIYKYSIFMQDIEQLGEVLKENNSFSAGKSPSSAAAEALLYMSQRVQGNGGAIVVNARGELGHHFTTERMAWASLRDGTLKYGINPGDNHVEDFTESVEAP